MFHVKAARVHVSDTAAAAAVWVSLRQVERVVQNCRPRETTPAAVVPRDCGLAASSPDVCRGSLVNW